MKDSEIMQEVDRLYWLNQTSEGRINCITDYIVRLLSQKVEMETDKLTPELVNHCVPVNGIHAPFCTGHEKRAEHTHEYLNSIYCSICGKSEF